MTLFLRGALANIKSSAENEDLIQLINKHIPVYKYVPQAGEIRASLDWVALLGITADIIGVGGALWAAYERYIKPKRERDSGSKVMLVINISDDNSRNAQLILGDASAEREVFIETFRHSLTALREEVSSEDAKVSKAIRVQESNQWIRIKTKN